ncbi:MAG: FAD-dependent oxidoreductase [Alkalispirochaeta sp.]
MATVEAARIPIKEIVSRHGGTFVEQSVTHIDRSRRVVSTGTEEFSWDVASIAIGSRVEHPLPVEPGVVAFGAKPVARLPELFSTAVRMLELSQDRPLKVVFIGGGASAVELSGNLCGGMRRCRPDLAERLDLTIVTRGDTLVPRMPAAAQQISRDSLTGRGIRLQLGKAPRAVTTTAVELENGAVLAADITVFCTGLSAPPMIAASGLPHRDDGALVVSDTLRTSDDPIYGGGDCIGIDGFQLEHIGVHAVRQSAILTHNVFREPAGDPLTTLTRYVPPKSPILILNLGDKTGVLVKGERVIHGSLPYWVKERIDWAFVRSGGTRTRPALYGPPRPSRPSRPKRTP